MKKLLIVLCFFVIKASAQTAISSKANIARGQVKDTATTTIPSLFNPLVKKDSIVVVTMDLDSYRNLLYAITTNIDSKNVTNAITKFFKEHAELKLVEADKPKSKPKN